MPFYLSHLDLRHPLLANLVIPFQDSMNVLKRRIPFFNDWISPGEKAIPLRDMRL